MPETPALEIRDLWFSFRGQNVLEAVDLTLNGGDFVGIIGPNGAGKSVLLRIIVGLLRPDRGTVLIHGSPPEKARGMIGFVPQYARFDSDFPIKVLDVVLMGRTGRKALFRRHRSLDRDRAMEALEQVEMADRAGLQIGKLSGGELQRVLIARALTVDARLLLLDEPTASLDPHVLGELYNLLGALTPRLTVVIVSHDVGVMHRHVRSIACLNRRLYYHETADFSQEMIDDVYGGKVDVVVHRHSHRYLDSHDPEHG